MADVLVLSEDEQQLRRGAQAGLLQVLVRVSGTQDVESSSLIANALRSPEAYYYQYSYATTDKTLQIGDSAVSARVLKIHFEPSAVARLLRRAGYPVWGRNRPSILLWLAVSDTQGRRILSESDVSDITHALRDQARLRGLPLLFPLLDLEDSAVLSTAEVWGAFLERVDSASLRYNPDSILTARIQKDTVGRWAGSWSYRIDADWQVLDTVSFSADEMVRTLVDQLANKLADRYAIDSSRRLVSVRVESVDSLEDYAAVSQYLESLAPVLASFVTQVDGSVVDFSLSTEGQKEQLVELIKLDQKMLLLNDNDYLYYRWQP